jgi:hypothetical protein
MRVGVHTAFQPFVERFVHARLVVRYFIQQNDVIISSVASTHDSGLRLSCLSRLTILHARLKLVEDSREVGRRALFFINVIGVGQD